MALDNNFDALQPKEIKSLVGTILKYFILHASLDTEAGIWIIPLSKTYFWSLDSRNYLYK